MKDSKSQSRPPLQRGSTLTIHRQPTVDRKPIHVTVERIDDGLIWVKGSSSAFAEGDSVLLEYKLDDEPGSEGAGSGRYFANGEIQGQKPENTFISCDGAWRRIQDRSFVRISTHGIQVKVPNPPTSESPECEGDDGDDASSDFRMLDVSAGGTCFETSEPFEVDDAFVCHFELPGQSCYVLPARVVRSHARPGHASRYRVAVEFVDLNEVHRSELLRWIYQQQSRRHNLAKGARAAAK